MKTNKKEMHFSLPKIWKSYWSCAKNYKISLGLIILAVLAAAGTGVYGQFFFRDLINTLTNAGNGIPTAEVHSQVMWIVTLMISLAVVDHLMRRIRDWAMIHFQVNTMNDLYDQTFSYIHGHSVTFFNNNFAGALVKKVNRYVGAFEDLSDLTVYYFLQLFVEFLMILSVFFTVHHNFGFLMLGWSIIYSIIVIYIANKKVKYDIAESLAGTKASGTLADTISNAFTIKVFAHKKQEEQYFYADSLDYHKKKRISWMFNQLVDLVQGFLVISFNLCILLFFVDLWNQGMVTAGDAVLLLSTQVLLDRRLWDLGNKLRRYYNQGAYALEMIEILEKDHEIQDKPHAKKLIAKKGTIEFDHVTFRYSDGKTILDDFCLTINAGEKVALVGHSGAGKSTITKAVLRFHDITSGQVLIDGQNISEVTQESLRSSITYVPQEPILFHRTLNQNIGYGDLDASKEEIIHAAQMAHAHSFIKDLPLGYDTYVGERGVKLSGGERQRVAIARAMLKKAPILILDEATSSLDSESEKHIQAALHNLMRGKTAIVIAHRLSTIMEMDRIIVMEEGRIIEQGTHQELLKKKGGAYKKLWDIQSGGFIGE